MARISIDIYRVNAYRDNKGHHYFHRIEKATDHFISRLEKDMQSVVDRDKLVKVMLAAKSGSEVDMGGVRLFKVRAL